MKTMFLAAAAALSLGIGSAYASEAERGTIANTQFTSIPGVVTRAPAQAATAVANGAERGGDAGVCHPVGPRHWLFPPNENGNG